MEYPQSPDQAIDWYPPSSAGDDAKSRFMTQTYGWMFVGLMVTAATSFGIASSETAIRWVVANWVVFYGALIAELAFVLALSAILHRLSALSAALGFLLYSTLNGLTFSLIFLLYAAVSINQIFLLAAGMFGGIALVGSVTKKELSGLGTFMAMGLWGIILTGVANLFFKSSALGFGTSLAAIVVFSGLTAFDARRIRAMAVENGDCEFDARKGAIFGALIFYLDFTNLFLNLLRIFGRRRD